MWPDTLNIIGWNMDRQGFGVIFDRAIPPFAEAHIAPAISGILGLAGLELTDIDRFACHPGGAKVIDALERAFALGQGVSTTSARSQRTMATCRLRPLSSYLSGSFNLASHHGPC